MAEHAKLATKAPETKQGNTVSHICKPERSQSMHSPVDRILHLQRTIGNQAVRRLFESGAIQAKLKVGQPGDIYEQEADRVAKQVMKIPKLQCPECEREPPIHRKPLAHTIQPFIQRQVGEEKEKEERIEPIQSELFFEHIAPLVQRQAENNSDKLEVEANTVAKKVLGNHISSSVPVGFHKDSVPKLTITKSLDSEPRRKVENILGYDFSTVRMHTDKQAALRTETEGAEALTIGRDIYFAEGRYRPDIPLGQALISHELTHVAQQRAVPRLSNRSSNDSAIDHLNRIESGEPHKPNLYQNTINAFRSQYPDELLKAQREMLLDPFDGLEVTQAPASMRLQRCIAGCSSCDCEGERTSPTPSQRTSPTPSPGEQSRTRAAELVATQDAVKAETDRLRSALREIRRGQSMEYHRTRTPEIINKLADNILHLSQANKTARLNDWQWFIDQGPPGVTARASDATWRARVSTFLQGLRSPLGEFSERYRGSQLTYWVKNTPAQVFQLIHEVGNTTIPPAMLYVIASKEGLIDVYIRGQVTVSATRERLHDTELRTIRVDRPVEGYKALGLDTFFTELGYRNQPLRTFFPPGFDETRLTEVGEINEFGTPVRSANAPDLRTGLQAQLAMLSRRRALFLEDARDLGYPAPTNEEIVYWTYVYYNTGPGDRSNPTASGDGGYQTLYRHRPGHPNVAARRSSLSDWINRGEYPNAIVVYQSYRMTVDSGILPGY